MKRHECIGATVFDILWEKLLLSAASELDARVVLEQLEEREVAKDLLEVVVSRVEAETKRTVFEHEHHRDAVRPERVRFRAIALQVGTTVRLQPQQ